MKTLKITLTALFAFMLTGIMAQTSVGIKAGVNFADLEVKGISSNILPNIQAISGPTVGIYAERSFSNQFSLVSELNYTQKGFIIDEGFNVDIFGLDIPLGVRAETKLKYVEMPVLAKMKFGNGTINGYVMGGPSLSYAADGYIQPVASTIIDINLPRIDIDFGDNMYNQWNIGGVIGAGVEYNTNGGKVFGDIRYNHSFSNVLSDPVIDIELKNKGFSLGIGYAMNF